MGANGTTNGGQMGGHSSAAARVRQLVPDLHNPLLDVTGRVDVLVARVLKRAVESSSDPVLRALYEQFRPVIDGLIHSTARRYNCAGLLRELGVAPSKPRGRTRSERRVDRLRREW